MEYDYISKRVAQLRYQKGISARDLSLSIGQSDSYINKIESGKAYPSINGLYYICEYFNITMSEFFDERNVMPADVPEIIKDLNKLNTEQLSVVLSIIRELIN